MEDFDVVKRLEASNYLYEYFPYFFLLNILLILLVHSNFLEKVSVVGILHHNAISEMFRLKLDKTYHKLLLGSSMKASLYEQILGCLIEAKILTSLRAFSFSLSDSFSILTFFSAYISLSAIRLT